MRWQMVLALALFALSMGISSAWEVRFVDEGVCAQKGWLSDDGLRMAYVKDMDGNPVSDWDREVFYADFSSMQINRITRDTEENALAAISPDGSKIAYTAGNWWDKDATKTLYLYDISSGRTETIDTYTPEDSSTFEYVGFASDGSVLLCIEWWIPEPSCGDNCYDRSEYCYKYEEDGSISHVLGYRDKIHYYYWESISETKVIYRKYYFAEGEEKDWDVLNVWNILTDTKYRFLQPEEYESVWAAASNTEKVALRYGSDIEQGKKGLFLYNLRDHSLVPVAYNPCDHPRRFQDFAMSKDGSRLIYTCAAPEDNPTRFSVHVVDLETLEDSKIFEASTGDVVDGHTVSDFELVEIAGVDGDGDSVVVNLKHWGVPEDQLWLLTEGGVAERAAEEVVEDNEIPIEQTTVIFRSGSGSYGDEVQIPVEIRNARNIGSMNIDVSEDTDVLRPIEVLPGSLTQDALFEYNIVNEKVRVAIVSSDGISGDGSLFYVKFEVTQPTEQNRKQTPKGPGRTLLEKYRGKLKALKIDNVYAKDMDGNVVDVKTINGTFVIIENETEILRGDVDGNGVVDSNDALLILKMSIGKERVKMSGDVNGDGKVLSDDALEVLKMSSKRMTERWRK